MSSDLSIRTQVLVIGGGPGGAYSAAILAREGLQATILEATKFPRYHIGESMLPSLKLFLRYIGAEEKPGAAVKFNQYKREGYTDFLAHDPENGSWNVVRSEFDEILLRHAEECGATVLEEHKVTEIQFDNSDQDRPSLRPRSATFVGPSGQEGRIFFDYLIDASGRNGIMSTKYLHNRRMNESLRNVACWGYWRDGYNMYKPGTGRENAPFFEALTDESGWGWFIPLHNGTVSVGVVMDEAINIEKKAAGRKQALDGCYSLKDHYLEQIQLLPGIRDLIGKATLADNHVKSASDYSYAPDRHAGDHFRLVGDAGAFIDPFFSSGVHLAILSGLTAAITVAASARGHCSEAIASDFHHVKSSTSYTRFLVVVMSAYKQIRAQDLNVLCDVDEDDFDRAFEILRPVIQGTADVGKKLTDDELQRTMDFCKDVFAPADPELQKAVSERFEPELLSFTAPIFRPDELIRLVDQSDVDAMSVINRINASKALAPLYVGGPSMLESEPVGGFVAHLESGRVGLVQV